jgi:hypothetical protein
LPQAEALIETSEQSRLHAYIVLCLLTGAVGVGSAPLSATRAVGFCDGRRGQHGDRWRSRVSIPRAAI